ncbi:MAG TPA: Gfo/Idh/MocA family oxidoreductase [Sedimentisphaerales bacterium]|nr:Gfo/Idh/MocA family oxidoreductase [Sedimentisphaerales bacterium]
MNHKNIGRREFLKGITGAAVGAIGFPYVVPSSALGKAGSVAPSNRVVVGCIGVGSQGSGVMQNFLNQQVAQVAAVCDVKSDRREAARRRVDTQYNTSGCKEYHDFRELLARDDIDAVMIASTDHWHVLLALAAARAGKDIYLEKPMGLSLVEDQTLRAACHERGTVFQFGTQQRSDRKFRQACELAVNGRLGKVRTINVMSPSSVAGGSMKPAPIPEWLDYDFWLGPAPYTPYTEDRCSNKLWWFHSDYAVGWIAGWGVHPLDIALWGGGQAVAGPVELEGTGAFPADGFCDTATDWRIVLKYASGLIMNYAGGPQPEEWRQRYGKDSHGIGFEGPDGWVHVNRSRIVADPPSLLDSVIGPNEIHLYQSNNHVGNFLECVKSRSETVCPIDVAVRADIVCHLSDIAIRTRRKIRWDPVKEEIIGDPEASRRLTRAMRSPWHL